MTRRAEAEDGGPVCSDYRHQVSYILLLVLLLLVSARTQANTGEDCGEIYLNFVPEPDVDNPRKGVFLNRIYEDMKQKGQNPEISRESLEELFEQSGPDKLILFAEHEGKLAAVMAFDIKTYKGAESFNRVSLNYLAVHPDFRGKKIGKAMIHQDKSEESSHEAPTSQGRQHGLIAWTQKAGLKRIITRVRDSNTDAKAFFEAVGFTKAQTETPGFQNPKEKAQWYEYNIGEEKAREAPPNGLQFTDPKDRTVFIIDMSGPELKIGTDSIIPQRKEPPKPSDN